MPSKTWNSARPTSQGTNQCCGSNTPAGTRMLGMKKKKKKKNVGTKETYFCLFEG